MENGWPEFVRDTDAESVPARKGAARDLTGWETVIFELKEDQEAGGSDFSTAALAP